VTKWLAAMTIFISFCVCVFFFGGGGGGGGGGGEVCLGGEFFCVGLIRGKRNFIEIFLFFYFMLY